MIAPAERWRVPTPLLHISAIATASCEDLPVLTKEYPDHYDARLILQLYDLRRESVMREARAAITRFRPATAEEAVAVLKHDHPLNTALRQVVGYWEMVYGMMKWGILHPEFALESTAEGLVVFSSANSGCRMPHFIIPYTISQ